MWYWMVGIEFDKHRSEYGENAMDLTSWEVIQTVPNLGYLTICYLFFVEAKMHYVTQDGQLDTLNISSYLASARTAIDSALTWLNT